MTFSEALTIIRIGEFNTAHSFIGKGEILTIGETAKLSRIMSQKRSHIYFFLSNCWTESYPLHPSRQPCVNGPYFLTP